MYEVRGNRRGNACPSPESRPTKQCRYWSCCTHFHRQPVVDALSRRRKSHCWPLFRYHLHVEFIDRRNMGLEQLLSGAARSIEIKAPLSGRMVLDWLARCAENRPERLA